MSPRFCSPARRSSRLAGLLMSGALALTLAACDGDGDIAVDMVGELVTEPGVPLATCHATLTVDNGLADVGLAEVQVSYGYYQDDTNMDQLAALSVVNVAPGGSGTTEGVILPDRCEAMNPLRKPIVSLCRTTDGTDCRKKAVLSQDGVTLVYE